MPGLTAITFDPMIPVEWTWACASAYSRPAYFASSFMRTVTAAPGPSWSGYSTATTCPASTPRTRTGVPGPTSWTSGNPTDTSNVSAQSPCLAAIWVSPTPVSPTARTTTAPSTTACHRDNDCDTESPPGA